MNLIDIFFLLLFVGGLALGFFQGMIRLTVMLIAFYLSVVLSSLYFTVLGGVFVQRFGSNRFVGEYVAFGLILLFAFVLLTAAGLYTFRYATLPGQLQYLDRFVGVLIGLLVGTLFIGLFAVLLWNLMLRRGGCSVDFPIMSWLCGSVQSSFLLSYFANTILPQVYGLIDPILPDAANILFVIQ